MLRSVPVGSLLHGLLPHLTPWAMAFPHRVIFKLSVMLQTFHGAMVQPGQYQFPFSFALPVSSSEGHTGWAAEQMPACPSFLAFLLSSLRGAGRCKAAGWYEGPCGAAFLHWLQGGMLAFVPHRVTW